MGVLVHPQSELIREPRLLVPHAKPVGSVVPDKGSPYYRNLLLYSTIQDSATQYRVPGRNPWIYFRSTCDFILNGGAALSVVGGQKAIRLATATAQQNIYTSWTVDTTLTFFDFLNQGYSGKYPTNDSLAFSFYIEDYRATTYHTGIAQIGSAYTSGFGVAINAAGTALTASVPPWTGTALLSVPVTKEWHTIVWTLGADGKTHKVYYKGLKAGEITTAATMGEKASIRFGRSVDLLGDSLCGGIGSWFFWDRCLTETEAASLSADLYQFMVPA